jgi:hypothetical protein
MYRKQTQTAQSTGYQAANHAQRHLQDTLMVEQSEALAILATASATYRTTISHIVFVNANCSVKFNRTSVEVLHNHKQILEGVRN